MATTILQAFQEYASNLEITDRQIDLVSQRRNNVVTVIKEYLSLYPTPSMLIGSYDRKTLTRYLSEGDVDVMVILHYGNNKGWDDSEGAVKALDRFKSILDKEYPATPKRRDRNCITMQFSEFRLDVVPAFSHEAGYYKIPDSIDQRWLLTNPKQFSEKISNTNRSMDGRFIPLIKMVKGWNREVGCPIRSFHLECLMYYHYQAYTTGYTYDSMLQKFFQHLPGYLSTACFDPVMREQVDRYLDNNALKTRRQIAIEKAYAAAGAAKEAFEDQEKYSSVIAIKEWKNLLGEFFPNYG